MRAITTATTLTVMGDRTGFVWQEPPSWGKIDELVAAKWKRMKIQPSELCTDLEFIRRAYLDLTGLPPSPEDIQKFLDDAGEQKAKREALIEHLIGSPEYVDFWANKWADLLQCNSKFLGTEGAEQFRGWIRKEVEKNTPYESIRPHHSDRLGLESRKSGRQLLEKSSARRARRWRIRHTSSWPRGSTATSVTTILLNVGRRTSIMIWRPSLLRSRSRKNPASEGRKVGGNDVESAKPLFEVVGDATEGDVKHLRTGKVAPPEFAFPAKFEPKEKASRRQQLANWNHDAR